MRNRVILAVAAQLLVAGFHTGCASAVSNPAPAAESEPVNEASPELLFENVRNYAASKGYRFGDGADSILRSAAQSAVSEIRAMPPDRQAKKLQEARENFERFIDAMIEAAGELPGYARENPGKIGEATYARAHTKLCPLWPICK